jgi:hypothetical protein
LSKDNHIRISLEVAVPYIVLPSLTGETQAGQSIDAAEVQTQVRLLPVEHNKPHRPGSTLEQSTSVSETATYTTKQGLFHLFRIATTLLPGQTYVLQILRQREQRQPSGRRNRQDQQRAGVTEESAFTFQCGHVLADTTDDTIQSSKKTLFPGRRHITINLDEEGAPSSYSIDSAEP